MDNMNTYVIGCLDMFSISQNIRVVHNGHEDVYRTTTPEFCEDISKIYASSPGNKTMVLMGGNSEYVAPLIDEIKEYCAINYHLNDLKIEVR